MSQYCLISKDLLSNICPSSFLGEILDIALAFIHFLMAKIKNNLILYWAAWNLREVQRKGWRSLTHVGKWGFLNCVWRIDMFPNNLKLSRNQVGFGEEAPDRRREYCGGKCCPLSSSEASHKCTLRYYTVYGVLFHFCWYYLFYTM